MVKLERTKSFSSSLGQISYGIKGEGPPIVLLHSEVL